MNEPVLLVGETGVGKTASVNYLAKITGQLDTSVPGLVINFKLCACITRLWRVYL